jgi:hypothetical protein
MPTAAIESPTGPVRTRRVASAALVLSLLGFFSLAAPARAQIYLSAAATGGTLGIGVQGDLLLSSHFGVRAAYNGFASLSYTTDNSGITYNGKFEFQNMPLLLDYYPSAHGSFHLTGGMVLNKNKVTATGVLDAGNTITINGHTYTEADLGGPLLGTITYPSTAWYAGLGWGSPFHKDSHWGFVCDIGVMVATPTAAITAPNAQANAALQADLQAQIDSTQANLKKYATYWPSITLGVSYKF